MSNNSTNCSSIYYLCYLFIRVQLSMKLNQCAGMIEKKSVFESLEIRKKTFCATIEIQIIVHHMQVFFSKHWCVRNKRYPSFPTVETTQMRISLTTGSQNGVSATQLNGVQLQRSEVLQHRPTWKALMLSGINHTREACGMLLFMWNPKLAKPGDIKLAVAMAGWCGVGTAEKDLLMKSVSWNELTCWPASAERVDMF